MDDRHEQVDQDEQDEQAAELGRQIMDEEMREEIQAEIDSEEADL
jgi:hypothetical protein